MPVSGPLSHIDISVGYPEKSIPFYDSLLTSIGYSRWWNIENPDWSDDNPKRATWRIQYADGSQFGIEVRPARMESRDRQYDLAFHAESTNIVDRAYEAILKIGGEIPDPPREYGGHPAYGKDYYAVFFADPDGLKVEVCYIKASNP